MIFREARNKIYGYKHKFHLQTVTFCSNAPLVQLGKPKGTTQASVKDRERIVELLSFGVSIRRISTEHLKYGSPSSLSTYIKARNLRAEADNIKQKRD